VAARLSSLTVRGLRCLHGLELTFEPMTALIGPNGAGKSSTVGALQFLFGQTDLDDDDFTTGLDEAEITVTAVIVGISREWSETLSPWLEPDGTLTVSRSRVRAEDGGVICKWTAARWQVESFGPIRAAVADGTNVAALKELYKAVRENIGSELPAWASKAQMLAALDNYESAHPDVQRVPVPDHALRFDGTGGAYDLTGMVELLVLPAMRDATEDSGEGRGSTLTRLVDITIRSEMDLDDGLRELSTRTTREYDRLIAAAGGRQLDELSSKINEQIRAFAPSATVSLGWQPRPVVLAPPHVRAQIMESGHTGDIGKQGHGVQRAYVFSLLRALLDARRSAVGSPPGLLLVVEEPEVYQHPVRARYVARVLADLAHDTAQSTQVIYTTHSPYFVSVDNIPAVRLLRLAATSNVPGLAVCTRAAAADLAEIALRLDRAREGRGQPWSPERVAAQLPGLMGSTVSEGLFADGVVLVEGEEDIGLIDGAAAASGIDLAALGIALVSVGGKDPLLLAAEVFRALGIPTYIVFDTDEKPQGKVTDAGTLRLNAMLTQLAGSACLERPGTQVNARWATGCPTLRDVLDREVGASEVREAYVTTARRMGLPESTCKNGHLVRSAVTSLYAACQRSATLDAVVAAVRALAGPGPVKDLDPGRWGARQFCR
jgi:putative ATP-dependent endonuclease of the OLD family